MKDVCVIKEGSEWESMSEQAKEPWAWLWGQSKGAFPGLCDEQRRNGTKRAWIQSAGVPALISTSLQQTEHSILFYKVTGSVLNI